MFGSCAGEDAISGMHADGVDGAAESIEDGSTFTFAVEELSCDIVDVPDVPVAAASPSATSKDNAASSPTSAASALGVSASSSAPTATPLAVSSKRSSTAASCPVA